MSDDELRAAAERHRSGELRIDDMHRLADAYLAVNPAPQPVTAEGLAALGAENNHHGFYLFHFPSRRVLSVRYDDGGSPYRVFWRDDDCPASSLGTARDIADVALLVEALRRLNGNGGAT